MSLSLGRIARFIAVGCTAAAVHFGTVVALVQWAAVAPLLANVAGWLLAFVVSFSGQHLLTFGDRRAPLAQALPRFFLLSAAGFVVNEAAYAAVLHGTGLRYDVALAIVLVGVAVLTYVASSRWAFRGSSAPSP